MRRGTRTPNRSDGVVIQRAPRISVTITASVKVTKRGAKASLSISMIHPASS